MALFLNITNASGSTYRGKTQMLTGMEKALKAHKVSQATIDVVLVSDAMIEKMNSEFLQHHYTTDVITFPLEESPLQGEIYISLDTARAQAKEYSVTVVNELCRLAVHGTLHLLGYVDTTDAEREQMHTLENRFIKGL